MPSSTITLPALLNPFNLYKERKQIINFLHYNIFRDIRSIFSLLGVHLCDNDHQLASFKNRHKKDRCFIIGNGPSLTINDLNKLRKETTFACNKIYLAFPETNWRPTYYVVEDDLVIQQNYDTINNLSGFTKFFPERTKKISPPFENSIYFNRGLYRKDPAFSSNSILKVHQGATVTYTMIQLACFMGFKEIYLLGVDFNFSYNSDRVNGKVITSEGEINHFHPEYRTPGEKWAKPRLQDQESAFITAREATKKQDCEIFDATRGGKLRVFQKVDLDALFSHG